MSVQLIQQLANDKSETLIDVGGGASTLVDHLIADGFQQITVLDLSEAALSIAKNRLGKRAREATWLEADITQVVLPAHAYHLWHDRAVFHFLTAPADRQRYVATLHHALKTGGTAILAAFALDGPTHCSGLEIMRHSPESLSAELGNEFELVKTIHETHQTPFNTEQRFVYCVFQRHSGN